MVRLKVNEERTEFAVVVFQFHYGTIKRQKLSVQVARLLLFQFHYGTIKSLGVTP